MSCRSKAPAVEYEIARTPGVVNKRGSEHSGRAEPQRVPPRRTRDHEVVVTEKRAQEFYREKHTVARPSWPRQETLRARRVQRSS